MIISGGKGHNSRSVEVISPGGNVSCSLPNLPGDGRQEHTHDSLVCGGSPTKQDVGGGSLQSMDGWMDGRSVRSTCLNLTSSGWVETSHNIMHGGGRWRHSSWPVADGIVLIGGYNGWVMEGYSIWDRTEIVKFDGTGERTFDLNYTSTM